MAEVAGHGLLCPIDRVDLIMSERQGIEIDYCPKCRGIWLDRGELDKILERSVGEEARPAQPQAYAPQPAPQAQPYPPRGHYDEGYGGHKGHRRRKSWLEELFD
ncbi:zf-TFIIB domain-containing protein [Phyllobacterium leguminum]|uniref:Transcription factor zinc-finger domain-containing protein n=1 Tax=Phyllobacterium leguminum TaxID=314237 RepID=A0A318T598_9HYPH|nr:zf-TFIIB domain-containing protein [Phyllobacterium leguminum]PYE89495.1 hypothetical protein C7477_1031 [Phyllobacterium leguminum]